MTGKGFGATEEEPDINNSIKLYSTFYDMANDQEVQPGCQNIVLHVKGQGGPRGPNLNIEFLSLLYAKEQELPASFYPIKKYCS